MTKYCGQAVFVFDGDKTGPPTKDSTSHHRAGCEGRKVMLNLSMKLQLKMNDFLSNKDNKQWFLCLLGEHIATCGCEIAYIPLALKVSDTCEALLVGGDTDLFVLVIHLADGNKHNVYFRPEPKK